MDIQYRIIGTYCLMCKGEKNKRDMYWLNNDVFPFTALSYDLW